MIPACIHFNNELNTEDPILRGIRLLQTSEQQELTDLGLPSTQPHPRRFRASKSNKSNLQYGLMLAMAALSKYE